MNIKIFQLTKFLVISQILEAKKSLTNNLMIKI